MTEERTNGTNLDHAALPVAREKMQGLASSPGEITAEEFSELDFSRITLMDLRDENLRIAQGELPGSYNVPLDALGTGLADLPRDKPVYVVCNNGDFSGEVAEILADRGYEAYDVIGGFKAFRACRDEKPSASEPRNDAEDASASEPPAMIADAPGPAKTPDAFLDAKGLKCPGPIVKVADALKELAAGQRLEVEATEDAFASDIAVWCARTGNPLESLEIARGVITARIVKGEPAAAPASGAPENNGKTFIVFSGDLDKTIAAFIMANGAASLGREVTMFFTFWGLNILRRPERVKVRKTPIGRMFGAMMPRGTRKLGLSRMNFGGAGARMIRAVMKRNGISSLEELIDQARAHGVRLVACQMSMEIMGITKEELVDGVELGGVATFLGSGEQSDMSLFI